MIRIKKIKLHELKAYISSNEFLGFKNIPISDLRMYSYINNPNARREDVVLYMAFEKDILVGYKTVLSDTFSYNEEKIKFGWLSGTWTHNSYRRKGISLKLFNEVYVDWEGKLMYTNYAENSKAVYDKSQKFVHLKALNGYRYYSRFYLSTLLAPKSILFKNNRKVLRVIDVILNKVFDLRFLFIKHCFKEGEIVEVDNLTDIEFSAYLKSVKHLELFKRLEIEYQWIQNFPWIKSDIVTKEKSIKYYFSYYSNIFESKLYKVIDENTNEISSFFYLNLNDEKLSVPYTYIKFKDISKIAGFIICYCKTYKVSCLTIYNEELIIELNKYKLFPIVKKKFVQNYFVSKIIFDLYPKINQKEIQSGDGDVVFT